MARLNVRPTSATEGDGDSSPQPATYSDDAASQQILAELTASASKPRKPPPSAAERGANYLNAARIDFRHSSPIRPANKSGKGKLSRVSILAEQVGERRPRGADLWDLPISPEKRSATQPQMLRHKPKTAAKSRDTLDKRVEDRQIFEEEPTHDNAQHESEHDTGEASGAALEVDPDVQDVYIEEELADGTARCALLCYKNDPKRGPLYQQCLNAAKGEMEQGLRCKRHADKISPTARCGALIHPEDIPAQCPVASQSETDYGPRCKRHKSHKDSFVPSSRRHNEHSLTQTNSKRNSSEDVETLNPQRSSKRLRTTANGEARDSAPTSSKETASGTQAQNISKRRDPRDTASQNDQNEGPVDTIEADMDGSTSAARQQRRTTQATNGSAVTQTRAKRQQLSSSSRTSDPMPSSRERRGKLPRVRSAEDRTTQLRSDDTAADAGQEPDESPATLGEVFEFLKREERSGECRTKLGRDIKQVCDESHAIFEEEDATLEEITDTSVHVREVLKEASKVDESEHRAFKGDAYAYVFRHLTVYLKSLHDWLVKDVDTVTDSLVAMRSLAPLIHDIITFKDIVASWKSTISQRYKGDRLIKDADSFLIAPLRYVDTVYQRRLRQLESKERARKKLERLYREIEKEEKEAERREAAEVTKRQRWQRWQELHIARMAAEPDPYRRRKLVICKLEEMDETDANGDRFERLPVFTNRTAPLRRLPFTANAVWTEEQETALLEGLQTFAGKLVFQNIFATYCRPGGALRNFTVTAITAKAAWISTSWTKLQQEKGWEIPEWVKQIPILP